MAGFAEVTLSALTRLTSEMKIPQKREQTQNRQGAMASAGGFMPPCSGLPGPQPRPPNPSSLGRWQEPLSGLPSHRTSPQ